MEYRGGCGFLLESSANDTSHPEWHLSLLPSLPKLTSVDGNGFLGNQTNVVCTHSEHLRLGPSERARRLSQWDQ